MDLFTPFYGTWLSIDLYKLTTASNIIRDNTNQLPYTNTLNSHIIRSYEKLFNSYPITNIKGNYS